MPIAARFPAYSVVANAVIFIAEFAVHLTDGRAMPELPECRDDLLGGELALAHDALLPQRRF